MLPERFHRIEGRVKELETLLGDPAVLRNRSQHLAYSKELARLRHLLEDFSALTRIDGELKEVESLIDGQSRDKELGELYQEEREQLIRKRSELQSKIEERLLSETDPNVDKNIIVEIRAGTGGEEAALFVRDLFRMYSRYVASANLSIEVMNTNATGKGGFKEIIFGVSGERPYGKFRFESGTHRVQRVPETEASGRIHTSAATVAVLAEANEVEVELKPEDLRIEVCRSGGPGGQGVNTTDSAVQIFHIPSGLMVRCQDERSQHKNKAKAMRVLRARLLEQEQEKQNREISASRRKQVGSGDRSEKIRTYNFPDNRVTDHRIGLTIHALSDILDGRLEELMSALQKEDRARRLKEAS